jgi:hypothetical protein
VRKATDAMTGIAQSSEQISNIISVIKADAASIPIYTAVSKAAESVEALASPREEASRYGGAGDITPRTSRARRKLERPR